MPKRGMYSDYLSSDDEKVKSEDSPDKQALQAPTIDPILFASLGATMGPEMAARKLFGQAMINYLTPGIPDIVHRISQYSPLPTEYAQKFANAATSMPIKGESPASYGDLIRRVYNVNRLGTYKPIEGLDNKGDRLEKIVYGAANGMDKIAKRLDYHVDGMEGYEAGKSNILPAGKGGTVDPYLNIIKKLTGIIEEEE